MNNRTLYIIFVLIAVIVILFIVFWKKPYQWQETFYHDDRNPYDLSILHDVLKSSVGENTFHFIEGQERFAEMIDSLDISETSNLICVGDQMYPDSADVSELLAYVRNGNKAFLVSEFFDEPLLDSILGFDFPEEEDSEEEEDEGSSKDEDKKEEEPKEEDKKDQACLS